MDTTLTKNLVLKRMTRRTPGSWETASPEVEITARGQ